MPSMNVSHQQVVQAQLLEPGMQSQNVLNCWALHSFAMLHALVGSYAHCSWCGALGQS